MGEVNQLLRQAVPLVPIGTYTPITSIAVDIVDRNHTMQYTIHGACPVIFGMLALELVQERLLGWGLYNSTLPACTVVENGAPAPPPSLPPPPSVPPARVLVEAHVTLNANAEQGELPLSASAAFARMALEWAAGRVAHAEEAADHHASGASLTRVTLTEGSQSLIVCTVDDRSELTHLLAPIQAASESAMCEFTSIVSCEVTTELPSPPAQPPPVRPPAAPPPLPPDAPQGGARSRLLQVFAVPPVPPGLPAPPFPPQLPPIPPLSPALYEHTMNLGVTRSFVVSSGSNNASTGPQELGYQIAAQIGAECAEGVISCPTA